MAKVSVDQPHAYLAGAVTLVHVDAADGKLAKASFTAISNSVRGSGDARTETATAIRWTLWGSQAENAAQYLGKGAHVNVRGRVTNNNYDKEGETIYALEFTADEVDYLQPRTVSETGSAAAPGAPAASPTPAAKVSRRR